MVDRAALFAVVCALASGAMLPARAEQWPATKTAPAHSAPSIALPDFDLVTNLETAPRPTRSKPARPGRVFDGPLSRDDALPAWRGGSLVAVYDYGVNCHIKVEPTCAGLTGVESVPDPSGFTDERTVANPADPKFIGHFGRRIGRMLDSLRPRPRDLLAAHIDNLGLVNDREALRLIYAAARAEFEKRRLLPLFMIKNNMRAHVEIMAAGWLKPEEVPYIVCENCLTKAAGAELEAGIVLARTYAKPIVLMEFGKAKLAWQNATPAQAAQLAERLRQENLTGFAYWGPDEDRYEFTLVFPGGQAPAGAAGGSGGAPR